MNASDFVVNVMKEYASFVGVMNQVAGFVVGVAAVDSAAGTYRTLTGQTVFSGESFTELAVHIEHTAGTNDITFADLTEEEWRIGQSGLVAVRLFIPLQPGSYK